jgi:hypothetical protein
MSEGDTDISTIFQFVFGKTEYKSDAECEEYLNDISVDDMPQSEQERRDDYPYPFVCFEEAHKRILQIHAKHKFLHRPDDQQIEQKIINEDEP